MKTYSMPFQVGWDITHKCNFRCKHCYFSSEQLSDPRSLPRLDALQFVDQLIRGKVFHLSIAGGEPLLYPHLIDVVRAASQGGITVSISTNASLITTEMAAALREAGAKSLQISLDGHCKEINDQIRGRGAFDRTLSGLSNAKSADIQVLLAIVLVRQNLDHILRYLEFSQSLGVSGVKVQTLLKSGLGEQNYTDLVPSTQSLTQVFQELWVRKNNREFPFNLILPSIGTYTKGAGCIGCKPGISTIRVNATGDVRACGSDVNAESIGNISTVPLAKIWQDSAELIRIRNFELVSSGESSTACGTSCGSVCKSRSNLALSGTIPQGDN